MDINGIPAQQADTLRRIKEVRAQAIEHTHIARRLGSERRELMETLIADGVSQAQIARELGVTRQAIHRELGVTRQAIHRELGVTRQAIQKMLAC